MKRRTIMKKLLVVSMVLLIAGSFLFAAGSGEKAASDKGVTIKVANYALLESGYEQFWKNVKTDFEAQNPTIKIEWVTAP